jgi:hypothetical protein
MSPGWQSKAVQTASSVEKRIAFAFPFFNTEILAIVMPTFSASSVTLIFRLASMTSMLIMIAMGGSGYTVRSFSDLMSTAFCNTRSNIAAAAAMTMEPKVMRTPMNTPPARSSLS